LGKHPRIEWLGLPIVSTPDNSSPVTGYKYQITKIGRRLGGFGGEGTTDKRGRKKNRGEVRPVPAPL
jgi:hypothetical protein